MSQEKEELGEIDDVNYLLPFAEIQGLKRIEDFMDKEQFVELQEKPSQIKKNIKKRNPRNPTKIKLINKKVFCPDQEQYCLNNELLQEEVNQYLQNIYKKESKFFEEYTLSKEEEDQAKKLILEAIFQLSVNNNEKAIDFSMQVLKIDRHNCEAIQILGFCNSYFLGKSLMQIKLCKTAQFCFELSLSMKNQCSQKIINGLILLGKKLPILGACLDKQKKTEESDVAIQKAMQLLHKVDSNYGSSMLSHFNGIVNLQSDIFKQCSRLKNGKFSKKKEIHLVKQQIDRDDDSDPTFHFSDMSEVVIVSKQPSIDQFKKIFEAKRNRKTG